MPSLFSKIISHEIPADFIFEDERWVAFLDIFPVRPGHVLLVPTCEYPVVSDVPRGHLAQVGVYLAELSRCVRRATGVADATICVNDGPAAGQLIPHVHWHIIPRVPGRPAHDFTSGCYSPVEYENEALRAAMAAKLRAHWRGI